MSWKKSEFSVLLIVSPETQVAVAVLCSLQRVCCRPKQEMKSFGPRLSTLIPQLTGRQVTGSKPRCCASQRDTSQSKQCKWFERMSTLAPRSEGFDCEDAPFFLLYQSKTSVSKHPYLLLICGVGILTPVVILGLILDV